VGVACILVNCVSKDIVQYFRRKMDSADSGDRPTVELFVKVSLFEPRA